MVISGLDHLQQSDELQKQLKGNVAYLCHGASVDRNYRHGLFVLKEMFGERLKKVFSPQHGFGSDAQDNMVESPHFSHPYFKLPVFSLYSETRTPTPEMLSGVDHVLVDLQDIGSRPYTYIYSLTLLMEACVDKDIEVVVLDRPNPINGEEVEGNLLKPAFASFIGRHPLPMRHGLSIGEIAVLGKRYWGIDCQLKVVEMRGWERWMDFSHTQLPWVQPSPNLPNGDAVFAFGGLVLFEGTSMSEGRGTTQSFLCFGHPQIEPFALREDLVNSLRKEGLYEGLILRPVVFTPVFDKHAGTACGGFQLHLTNRRRFRPWRVGQVLCRELYRHLGPAFSWRQPPFEYEEKLLPIDMINGSDRLRHWVENQGTLEELNALEMEGRETFLEQRKSVLKYL